MDVEFFEARNTMNDPCLSLLDPITANFMTTPNMVANGNYVVSLSVHFWYLSVKNENTIFYNQVIFKQCFQKAYKNRL